MILVRTILFFREKSLSNIGISALLSLFPKIYSFRCPFLGFPFVSKNCLQFAAIAVEENDHLKQQLKNITEDKQSVEKQRSEAVKNLEEMTKNMGEFRNHTKNKLERLGGSESGLKGEIEDLKKQIETCQSSMKVKEDSVKELQLQIEDMKRLAESKDERIQDLNGRLESCKHENELLKESNTITSTALSDAKLELESLKRTNACSCSEIQNHEHLNREIESLRQILISKDSELNTIKRAISTTSLDNVGFYSERVNSDNIAEPDMHEYSVMEAEKVRLRKQIKELENSLKSKNSELEAVKSQLSLWSSQYDEAKNFINANDCLVMRLERDNQQKQNSLEKCRKEISVLKVKVEDAKNEIITVEGKLKRSQMEYHQLKLAYNEGVCKYDNVSKKLEQNLEEFREKEEEYQNHIDQLREELKELTGNFELLASTVDNKDRTIKELQSHFDVMMPNLESVKGELTSLNSAHNQLKEQSSRVQEEKRKQIKHLESALGVYKEEVEKLKLQLRHQKDTFDLESENYGIEIEDLRGKVNKYESQLTATKTELSAMDKHVKELEAEAICKDGKISELELHIAEMLKEKSEMLEKHSKDSSDFENRFEDLNKLYQSVNSELNETQEKLSSANERLELKIAKVAQLEDLCKDNDSKIKSFIEQLEMKSNILEKEIQNKKEAEELVCELQDEMKLKTAQNLKLADELNITRERYKEIDRTFSDYYQGSQDILAHNKALSEKVKELQSSMQNLKASLESTRDDLTQSNDQIGILQSLLSEKQIDCANKQQKILELEHRNQVGNMCKEDVENKVTELEQKLEKVKTSFQDSEQKVKVLEGQLVMKDDQISMREDKISLLTGKLDSIVKLDDSNLKKLEEVTRSASEKSEEVQKVRSENVKLREDIKTCEAEMSKMYRKNSELDEKLKKLDSETNALNASKKSLSEELNLKDSEVQTLKTSVEKYELRESKLKVAVTDEISRLKTVVEKLTEEHNKELKEQHDQFKESLSTKDFHMQKIAQDMQQSSMREQILRNDLAQAINQINYFKNNQAFYLSPGNMNNQGASSNGTLNSPDSPTSYTFEQNTDQVYQGHPDERYDAMQKQHHRKHQKHRLDNGLSGVVYPAGTNVPKFSSITGKGVVASTNSGVSPRTVPSIDRMTEIRSDPMLLNFHYLPHDEQQQAMEMPSPSEGQTQRSVESQGLLKPHQTLQRTYSDSRALKSTGLMSNEETSRQNVNARENLRPEKSSPNISADKVAPKSAPPKKLNDTSRGADSPFLEISADVADIFRKVKENMECEIPKTPNNDVQNQLESKKGRSYKVPLSNGDENAAGMKSKASKRMSVQEMSFTYNSEDELMNQSFHSLTSLNASQEGLDSVRSHTPAMLEMSHNSENGDHLRNELSAVSFDADGDRVANSTGILLPAVFSLPVTQIFYR